MLRPLTIEEMIEVNVATKGENSTHRRWPKEVVEAFLAADVIRDCDQQKEDGERRICSRWTSMKDLFSDIITDPLAAISLRRLG